MYQYSAESEYNTECTTGMDTENFRALNHNLLNKDPYVVPEQTYLIILDSKSSIYMAKNGKYTKQTRHITRIMNIVLNGKYCNLHKTVWCEGGMKPSDIGTKNVREYKLNTRLEFDMLRLNNIKTRVNDG